MSHAPAITTQQRNPGRATWRTVVSTVLSILLTAGIVVPLVLAIIQEELGDLLGESVLGVVAAVGGVLVAISAALTRIMAIPAVDAWLDRLGLSSAPGVAKAQDLARLGRED